MSQLDTNTATLNNILTKINNLPEKQNLSAVTATASDVLSPKVIVGPDGQPITGTMLDLSFVENCLIDSQWKIDGDNLKTVDSTIWQGYVDSIYTIVPQYQIANAINLSSEQIAEGEIVLGITGTHSGGMKITTGSLAKQNYSSNSLGYFTILISNPGFKTSYALLDITLYGPASSTTDIATSRLRLFYNLLDTSTSQIPTLIFNSVQSGGTYYSHPVFSGQSVNYSYIGYNQTDVLSFHFAQYAYSSSRTMSALISYTLLGE